MRERREDIEGPRQTRVFTDGEVELVVDQVVLGLWTEFLEYADRVKADVGRRVRLIPLAQRCMEAREQLGLTVTESAATLKCPQCRLTEIEYGRLDEIDPKVLRCYVEFLGIEDWVDTWVVENSALASMLGLDRSRAKGS